VPRSVHVRPGQREASPRVSYDKLIPKPQRSTCCTTPVIGSERMSKAVLSISPTSTALSLSPVSVGKFRQALAGPGSGRRAGGPTDSEYHAHRGRILAIDFLRVMGLRSLSWGTQMNATVQRPAPKPPRRDSRPGGP